MLAAADHLAGLDWVDGERLEIYGASYGNFLAVLALARDPHYRFRCGVPKFGECDILSSWAQGDRPGREDLERQMGHPTANRTGYRAGSPVYDLKILQENREQHTRRQIKRTMCQENDASTSTRNSGATGPVA